jgi:Na+/H+ antiporter NhaC
MTKWIASVVLALSAVAGLAQNSGSFKVEAPELTLAGIPFDLKVTALHPDGTPDPTYRGTPVLSGAQLPPAVSLDFVDGKLTVSGVRVGRSGQHTLVVTEGDRRGEAQIRTIPGLLSILPPLVAIALALTVRQVVFSLVSGIWLGAVFRFDYDLFGGVFRVLDHFVLDAMSERNHVQIILFSLLFGGMVGVITRNGGARGVATAITRLARTAVGGQLAAWGLAFFLFFDDYANILVRGNLMRPITDRLRVSREKLSFLVDTGAATVASIFLISTWIGYEVGLIDQALRSIGSDQNAYSLFVRTIPYRFYPLLALAFAFLAIVLRRDLGSMAAAEIRARREGKVLREGAEPATDLAEGAGFSEDVPARWINGLVPVATILVVGLGGLYLTGTDSLTARGATSYGLGDIVSAADSYVSLLWASLAGCLVAVLASILQRILTLAQAMEAWVQGLKSMVLAMLILVLAWSLGSVTQELHTADYLVQILRGVLSPYWLPVLTFAIASGVAFSTGTSWATMAILMPIVIPLAHTLSGDAGLAHGEADRVLLGVVSSVLAGAVFGDHCSPISDTTILSSMASACDHIDHVRTQLPYALIAACVGMAVGDIPTAYGLSPWISLAAGILILAIILRVFGHSVEGEGDGPDPVCQSDRTVK